MINLRYKLVCTIINLPTQVACDLAEEFGIPLEVLRDTNLVALAYLIVDKVLVSGDLVKDALIDRLTELRNKQYFYMNKEVLG